MVVYVGQVRDDHTLSLKSLKQSASAPDSVLPALANRHHMRRVSHTAEEFSVYSELQLAAHFKAMMTTQQLFDNTYGLMTNQEHKQEVDLYTCTSFLNPIVIIYDSTGYRNCCS